MSDTPETNLSAPLDPSRDLTLHGVVLPPAEAPPLAMTLGPLRPATVLALPDEMPDRSKMPLPKESKIADETELQMNALIADCHFLLRDVAYRCIAKAEDSNERLSFLRAALRCAETAAEVAQVVPKLRATPLDEDRKDAIAAEMRRQYLGPKTES